MKKHKLLLLLLLSITISCNKCKKKEDPPPKIDTTVLPPATTTGENTMGCLINGEVWLPLKENFLGNLVYDVSFEVTPLSEGGGVFIQALNSINNIDNGMNISADDVLNTGVFSFPSWSQTNKYWNFTNGCGYYDLDSSFNNYIEITKIDFNTNIISGKYEMRVINDDCDTITITEGRFDLSGN